MHTEPVESVQQPDESSAPAALPLCLLQFSCGCGPVLAQVLLDILSLMPPPCASLFWPLQHNVISSLGAAQLRGLRLALQRGGAGLRPCIPTAQLLP